jgi:hypothetical protein
VIDARPQDGQSQGDVHRVAEAHMLDYRQALIVIHRDDHIGGPQKVGSKRRIRRHRPLNVQTLRPQFLNDGLDHLDLLAAQMPGLAGVRIESEYGDSRCGHGEMPLHVHIDDAKGGAQPVTCDRPRDIGKRQMRRHQRDP